MLIFNLYKFDLSQFWYLKCELIRTKNKKVRILKGLKLKRHKLSWSKNEQKKFTGSKIEKTQIYIEFHLSRTNAPLANNGQPLEIQKLHCQVDFSALRFVLSFCVGIF